MKEIIAVICPLARDQREFKRLNLDSKIHFLTHHPLNFLLEDILFRLPQTVFGTIEYHIDQILKHIATLTIGGVMSSDDYPGAILAAIVAQKLGLSGPDPRVTLALQHKYYARVLQQILVPEATPRFWLIDPYTLHGLPTDIQVPLILKPVKSKFSINAHYVAELEELEDMISKTVLPRNFLAPFSSLLNRYLPEAPAAHTILAEQVLQGAQCTLEGYVYQGTCVVLGVVDSIMYPGTMSFERFVYPSQLAASVQKRMASVAAQLMGGVGFDNGFFNIEFMYDEETDTIGIIEVNPRLCNQFADLYERVDGRNTYQLAYELARGNDPRLISPQPGIFKCAASCVLRVFDDHLVTKVPTSADLDTLYNHFPDVRVEICVQEGHRLSSEKQDGKSFRYCVINLGGTNAEDLQDRLSMCKKLLPFALVKC
jgi:biotin carboxylase